MKSTSPLGAGVRSLHLKTDTMEIMEETTQRKKKPTWGPLSSLWSFLLNLFLTLSSIFIRRNKAPYFLLRFRPNNKQFPFQGVKTMFFLYLIFSQRGALIYCSMWEGIASLSKLFLSSNYFFKPMLTLALQSLILQQIFDI